MFFSLIKNIIIKKEVANIEKFQREARLIPSEFREYGIELKTPKQKMLKELLSRKERSQSSTWREEAVIDGIYRFMDKFDEAIGFLEKTIDAIISHGEHLAYEMTKLINLPGNNKTKALLNHLRTAYNNDVISRINMTHQYFQGFVDSLIKQFDLLPDERFDIQRGSFLEEQIAMIKKEETYYLERVKVYEDMAIDSSKKIQHNMQQAMSYA